MPATYAPGPRCNSVEHTTGFWACQASNTRYLASTCLYPLHVGGIPVDIPGDELGTGWARIGGKGAKLPYWTGSRRASRRVSVESSPLAASGTSARAGDSVERLSAETSLTWAPWAE